MTHMQRKKPVKKDMKGHGINRGVFKLNSNCGAAKHFAYKTQASGEK